MNARRLIVPGEMVARELCRRPMAIALLTALPLAFYWALAHHSDRAVVVGGIAMAFSTAGASIFSALNARAIDQRLVLAGYRPRELLFGRLVVLWIFGLVIAAAFSVVMVIGTGPADPGSLVAGLVLVALTSVPFGLAVGEFAPNELEGVLILIGVVGVQLTLESTQAIAKALPFWGAERLLESSVNTGIATAAAVPAAVAYATVLLAAAVYFMHRRSPQPPR
jgi:hypothetical protein